MMTDRLRPVNNDRDVAKWRQRNDNRKREMRQMLGATYNAGLRDANRRRFPRSLAEMISRPAAAAAALAVATVCYGAERSEELNRILEQNASAAAYARVCDEEPMSEQLKANTMMLLATTGMEAHNVQLGSAKFNDVMRREIASLRNTRTIDCPAKVQEARDRLAVTQGIIRGSHRDAASGN